MSNRLTSRYAAVTATIALFAALGGSAYALTIGSTQIKNNAIRSVDIRQGQVKSVDLKNGDVRSRDLRNGDVRTQDLRNGDVRGADLKDNDVSGGDIQDGTLTAVDFAAGVLTGGQGGGTGGGNADTLGGVPKEGFQPAGVVLRGMGQTDAAAQQVIIDAGDLGVQVLTDGDADAEHRVFVKNTGNVNIKLSSNASQAEAQLGPNTSAGSLLNLADDGKAGLRLSIIRQNDPSKGLEVDCGFHDNPNVVQCSAVRFG